MNILEKINANAITETKQLDEAYLGKGVFIKRMSLAQTRDMYKLSSDESDLFILKACLVNEQGEPIIGQAEFEALKNASGHWLMPIVSEVMNFNMGSKIDPKT